jgi:hypothetical protein
VGSFFDVAEHYYSNWIRKKADSVLHENILLFFCVSKIMITLSEKCVFGECLEHSTVGNIVSSHLLKESEHSVSEYALTSSRSSALLIQKDSF